MTADCDFVTGSTKNRQFYEPTEEFKASMPADVDDLMVCPMWGKRLHVLSYKLEELEFINLAVQKYGRAVEIHAVICWNGNELVGPDGVEDEPMVPIPTVMSGRTFCIWQHAPTS